MQTSRLSLLLALPLAGACAGAASQLVDLDAVSAGEECADGGVTIRTGLDANGDGSLQSDEVDTTEVVCNGAGPSSAALLASSEVEPGDGPCDHGGTKIEAGMDDGDPGGVADDGILQPEEVDSTEYLCDDPPGGEGSGDVMPLEPPAGPRGSGTIVARGGEGTVGSGGDGGYFYMEMDYGTVRGGVRVYATGSVDASFTYPSSVSYDLGEKPLNVTADRTLQVVESTIGLSEGDVYRLTNSGTVYQWVNGSGERFTGLSVSNGATLTVESDVVGTTARLDFSEGCYLAGTLTTELDINGNRDNLNLDCGQFVGASTGLFDLTGAGSFDSAGGDGGELNLDADGDEETGGGLFNEARVNTSGGGGTSGGDAGDAEFDADYVLYNTGNILARGGNGSDGPGGDGGYVTLDNDYADQFNSGDINTTGGDAVDGNAGDGGDIYMYNGYYGEMRHSGTYITSGGNASGCTFACDGGQGGYVQYYMYSNELLATGDVTTTGGDATAANGAFFKGLTEGGDGGEFEVYTYYESGWANADVIPPGNVWVSSSMNLSGGDGQIGGEGGYVYTYYEHDGTPLNQVVAFLGMDSIDLRGGRGATSGGDGGYLIMEPDYAYADGGVVDDQTGGPAVNYANVTLDGGEGLDGQGGDAGYFEMYTEDDYGWASPWAVVINGGNVSAKGGRGTTRGGDGGAFYLYGYRGATNAGNVNCDGGDATDVNGIGGTACDEYDEWDDGVYIFGDYGPVVNTGNISAQGGNGTGTSGGGGNTNDIEIVGWPVTQSGNILAKGGNGASYGSDGSEVFILSMFGRSNVSSSVIDVAGGTADEADDNGDEGSINVDGEVVTNDY